MSEQIINETNEKEKKMRNILAIIVGSAMSLFHIYYLGFATMSSWPYRLIHVTFAIVLIIILHPLKRKGVPWRFSIWIDLALILIALFCCIYIYAEIIRSLCFLCKSDLRLWMCSFVSPVVFWYWKRRGVPMEVP